MIKKNIKMRVTSKQSEKIQEICFANGVYWSIDSNLKVQYTHAPYLFIEDDSYITYSLDKGWFQGQNTYEEVNPEIFIQTKGTMKMPKPKETNKESDKAKMLTEDIMEVKSESNETLTIELKMVGAIMKRSDGSTELNFKGNKRMILNLSNDTYKILKDIWVEYTDKRNNTKEQIESNKTFKTNDDSRPKLSDAILQGVEELLEQYSSKD